MDKRTAEALEKCIKEKWEPMASGVYEYNYEPACALCVIYNSVDRVEICRGCPVYEKTGRTGCEDSPYVAWRLALSDTNSGSGFNFNDSKVVYWAQKELEFLESLRVDKDKNRLLELIGMDLFNLQSKLGERGLDGPTFFKEAFSAFDARSSGMCGPPMSEYEMIIDQRNKARRELENVRKMSEEQTRMLDVYFNCTGFTSEGIQEIKDRHGEHLRNWINKGCGKKTRDVENKVKELTEKVEELEKSRKHWRDVISHKYAEATGYSAVDIEELFKEHGIVDGRKFIYEAISETNILKEQIEELKNEKRTLVDVIKSAMGELEDAEEYL